MDPNFLVIGPPKCASTSLHFYLNQHPEVYMAAVKETNFFTHDYYKGLDFYKKYFKDAGNAKAIGEATPSYSFLPFARDRIHKHYPQMKFIICLRNPVERAFSNWLMYYEAGIEKLDFKSAININLKQMSYVSYEGEQGAKLWDSRRYKPDISEKWIREYIQPGMNAEILGSYYSKFNKEQVKYIFLEDLYSGLNTTLQDIYGFLNIRQDFIIPVQVMKNLYFNRGLHRIVNNIIGIKNAHALAKYIPAGLKNIAKSKKTAGKKPGIKIEDRQFLWEVYKQDIARLELLTGRDLSNWKP